MVVFKAFSLLEWNAALACPNIQGASWLLLLLPSKRAGVCERVLKKARRQADDDGRGDELGLRETAMYAALYSTSDIVCMM